MHEPIISDPLADTLKLPNPHIPKESKQEAIALLADIEKLSSSLKQQVMFGSWDFIGIRFPQIYELCFKTEQLVALIRVHFEENKTVE